MSLINDYLKKLGNGPKRSLRGNDRAVPPILQRIQNNSSKLMTKKTLFRYGVMAVVVYCIGYFMFSSVQLAQHPGDNTAESFDNKPQPHSPISKQVVPVSSEAVVQNRSKQTVQRHEVVHKRSVATRQGIPVVVQKEKKEGPSVGGQQQKSNDGIDNSSTIRPKRGLDVLLADQQEPYPIIDDTIDTSLGSENPHSPQQKLHRRVVFTESKNQSAYFYQIALQAQHDNNYGRAERYYQKVLTKKPNHINCLVNLSAIYIQEQRLNEAQSLLDHVLSLAPDNSKALVNAGMIALQNNKRERARKFFLRALQRNPVEKTALLNLSFIAQQKENYDAAEEYLKKLIRISPDNTKILLAYAGVEEKKKQYTKAVRLYQQSLKTLNMQQDIEQYTQIKQRIQVLRQYAARQNYRDFFRTDNK